MGSKDYNSFQKILTKLYGFWDNFGCVLIPPSQTEISSPLFHPTTFFGMIEDNNIDTMYFQPHVASKEFDNDKFGIQNYTFLKFQVVLKSKVLNPQQLFLNSLEYIGLNLKDNDIRFINENYENFIFRFNAFGYRILFNNVSIAKLHYVQNIGYHDFTCVPTIITFDLDKILTILQNNNNLWDISWNGSKEKDEILYSDIMYKSELENHEFIKDSTTNEIILKQLINFKDIAIKLLDKKIIIPAYINILKAKYCLDILCLRDYIMYDAKLDYSKSLRELVDLCCENYLHEGTNE
ncbi:MAG TPA: glycine--tRNA ligase subunit alpha [Rickettsiales bacterium]|nr:glycine--tRNA ligase subunit alpha [Rickettsiales bacterium]